MHTEKFNDGGGSSGTNNRSERIRRCAGEKEIEIKNKIYAEKETTTTTYAEIMTVIKYGDVVLVCARAQKN